MSKYIKQFDYDSEYNDFVSGGVGSNFKIPLVSYTEDSNKIRYNNYESIPLTFEIHQSGKIAWTLLLSESNLNEETKTIEYSLNGGEWVSVTSSTDNVFLNAVSGDTIQFRGNNTGFSFSSSTQFYRNGFSGTTAHFTAKGNIMSLLDKNNFVNKVSFESDFAFYALFHSVAGMLDASNLVLPATILTHSCYRTMFQGCSRLKSAPSLPAMTLAPYCYYYMFNNCHQLNNAPRMVKGVESGYYDNMFESYETPQGVPYLPANKMEPYCYYYMFGNCRQLTELPELGTTTLATGCYGYMFCNCSGITSVPENYLPIENLAYLCYCGMFQGCISLVDAPNLPSKTLASNCYYRMFSGCISLFELPELPATTLANYCYRNMFDECTSLITVPKNYLPATGVKTYCYASMFNRCSSLTQAPDLPATQLTLGCYRYMFSNCTSLTTAPELPASILYRECYTYMFYGCTSLTKGPSSVGTSGTTMRNSESACTYMFSNCTSLTTAPELPAKTLIDYCYEGMFSGCSNLNYIKCLATDISASDCISNWVNGVANTGTFVKAPSMTGWTTGVNGIPTGWEVQEVNQ